MKQNLNKKEVCKIFSESIQTYCSEAIVQKRIAEKMIKLIIQHLVPAPKIALEIGCGSGFFSHQLFQHFPGTEWIINDISENIRTYIDKLALQHSIRNYSYHIGDAEIQDFRNNIDLITSTSAIQWFHNTETFFEKAAMKLNQEGHIAISTFGPKNYIEIKQITGNSLQYQSIDELKAILEKNFIILRIDSETHPLYFPQTIDLLQHIKSTGVNSTFRNHWTKHHLNTFTNNYEIFRNEQGYRLTYHPIYIIAKKK